LDQAVDRGGLWGNHRKHASDEEGINKDRRGCQLLVIEWLLVIVHMY